MHGTLRYGMAGSRGAGWITGVNMRKRQFGKLFDVSRLTLGGGGIGQVWGSTSRDEAIATVRAAHDAGVNLFDMAPLYGRGEAETVMGLAFESGYPEDVRVTTKCMLGNASADDVEPRLTSSLNESLNRLKREHVDIYILHGYVIPDGWRDSIRPELLPRIAVEWSTYRDHVVPAFEKLKRSGRIGAWGVTAASTQATNLKVLESAPRPDVVQCITNLLDSPGNMAITSERPDPRAVIAEANKRSVGVMGIRAVAAGSLTDSIDREVAQDSSEKVDFDRAQPFRAIAADIGTAPAVLAHQYALAMEGVSTVVLGVKNRSELAQCLAAESAPDLDASLIDRIETAIAG
jgi:aryl-alcohol dehydrogenase-like predicted oxidoreductase